jgi:hypothetical protein
MNFDIGELQEFSRANLLSKIVVFWDVAPYSLVDIDRRFAEAKLKCRSISTRLHGATCQKIAIFIFDVVRTSNLSRFTFDSGMSDVSYIFI